MASGSPGRPISCDRIHSSSTSTMGVIRKKTAARGGEGGVKYVCDVCSADITSTVRRIVVPRAYRIERQFAPSSAQHAGPHMGTRYSN